VCGYSINSATNKLTKADIKEATKVILEQLNKKQLPPKRQSVRGAVPALVMPPLLSRTSASTRHKIKGRKETSDTDLDDEEEQELVAHIPFKPVMNGISGHGNLLDDIKSIPRARVTTRSASHRRPTTGVSSSSGSGSDSGDDEDDDLYNQLKNVDTCRRFRGSTCPRQSFASLLHETVYAYASVEQYVKQTLSHSMSARNLYELERWSLLLDQMDADQVDMDTACYELAARVFFGIQLADESNDYDLISRMIGRHAVGLPDKVLSAVNKSRSVAQAIGKTPQRSHNNSSFSNRSRGGNYKSNKGGHNNYRGRGRGGKGVGGNSNRQGSTGGASATQSQ
jgi:hypothetical protein